MVYNGVEKLNNVAEICEARQLVVIVVHDKEST